MNVKQIEKALQDNTPHILTGLAVTGVVATTYLAVKATPSAMEALHGELYEAAMENRKATRTDMLKATWRFYIPAALVGGATIGCIIGANTVSTKRQAALVAGYTLTDRAYREYQDKVREQIGPKKEEELRADIHKDFVEANPPSHEVLVKKEGEVLCLDAHSGRYFFSTKNKIEKAVNEINLEVINNGYASMNDFWRILGLPTLTSGDEYGWNTAHTLDVYFSYVGNTDDEPVLCIDYHNSPVRNFYKNSPWN